MSDEIQDLKQHYRRVKAPPYLATRIRAAVTRRSVRRPMWVPLATGITLVFGVLSVMLIMQQQATQVITPIMPSLTMLSRLTPDKPKVSVPGMTRIRSVKTPALPPKPNLERAKQPQSNFQFEEDDPRETNHAYI